MRNNHLFFGLFVGSFNPVTTSHLKITLDLLEDKIVNHIYFLPVNSKKTNLESIDRRLDMLNLVLTKNMTSLNIYNYSDSGIFNYFVLEKINKDKKITHIIMGSDLFLKFYTFTNYEDILKKYSLIIINRGNNLEKELEKYENYRDKIIIINKTYPGSSTESRNSLKETKNIYLDNKVLDYIKKNNLYN
ncbi:MAG: hypothetical protein IJ501_06900 [Bacilli bacterium]|nr:hypothetical protein [Bacilli bacterium]